LLGLALGAAAYFWKPGEDEKDPQTNFVLLGLLITLLIFLVAMSLNSKKADRYVLSVFIMLDLLSGIGFWLLIKRLQRGLPHARAFWAIVLVTVVIGLQAFLVWRVAPYYHSYYNPMWGNANRYFEQYQVGSGEGLDQAARYLNSQEGIENKVVFSWYSATFDLFFDNSSEAIYIHENDAHFEEIMAADYAVIYISQWQRQSDKKLILYLAGKQPEHTIEINGFEYVKIYNLADLRAQIVE
jgi:hypothetical protein